MVECCDAFRETYQRAYRKLIVALPIDKFTPFISDKQSLLFHDGVKASQEERSRDAILNLVKEDLEAGKVASFEQLLEAMEAYVDAENDIVIGRILKIMKKEIEGIVTRRFKMVDITCIRKFITTENNKLGFVPEMSTCISLWQLVS